MHNANWEEFKLEWESDPDRALFDLITIRVRWLIREKNWAPKIVEDSAKSWTKETIEEFCSEFISQYIEKGEYDKVKEQLSTEFTEETFFSIRRYIDQAIDWFGNDKIDQLRQNDQYLRFKKRLRDCLIKNPRFTCLSESSNWDKEIWCETEYKEKVTLSEALEDNDIDIEKIAKNSTFRGYKKRFSEAKLYFDKYIIPIIKLSFKLHNHYPQFFSAIFLVFYRCIGFLPFEVISFEEIKQKRGRDTYSDDYDSDQVDGYSYSSVEEDEETESEDEDTLAEDEDTQFEDEDMTFAEDEDTQFEDEDMTFQDDEGSYETVEGLPLETDTDDIYEEDIPTEDEFYTNDILFEENSAYEWYAEEIVKKLSKKDCYLFYLWHHPHCKELDTDQKEKMLEQKIGRKKSWAYDKLKKVESQIREISDKHTIKYYELLLKKIWKKIEEKLEKEGLL